MFNRNLAKIYQFCAKGIRGKNIFEGQQKWWSLALAQTAGRDLSRNLSTTGSSSYHQCTTYNRARSAFLSAQQPLTPFSAGPVHHRVPSLKTVAIQRCTLPLNGIGQRNFSTKKIKMKSYSSYKKRFRLLGSGEYKRSRCGNAHLAFGKRISRKRRLRQSTTTYKGYARVMKKLGFKAK